MRKNNKVKSIVKQEREARLKKLRQIVGVGGVRSLQTTGILKIWKNSRPHNWWIESARGEQVWHSETTFERPRVYPDLGMFYTTTLNIGNYLPERWKLKDEYR